MSLTHRHLKEEDGHADEGGGNLSHDRRKRINSTGGATFEAQLAMVLSVSVVLGFVFFAVYHSTTTREGSLHHHTRSSPVQVDNKVIDVITTPTAPPRREPKIEWPPVMVEPPMDGSYPTFTNLLAVVHEWNPDIPDPPPVFKETLQHFNYSDPAERKMAERFRDAELPFKVYDVPEFNAVAAKWTDEYLSQELSKPTVSRRVERSNTNHFMYWNGGAAPRGYKPPTEVMNHITFDDWLRKAKHAEKNRITNETEHFYFMSNAPARDSQGRTFIGRDLSMFSTDTENFFITNVAANKGIQCRFGMRGIIAECHYDTGKNMVAMLKGTKRYILNPPSACNKLAIIKDKKHPSWRHSEIDWSNEDVAVEYKFGDVPTIDTIVRQGEVLYIPSFWFHYIISLDYSVQCNSRSGIPESKEGQKEIEECLGISLDGDHKKYMPGAGKNTLRRRPPPPPPM